MDKNKFYCPMCKKELKFNKEIGLFNYICNCYDIKKFKYTLQWCEKCQDFTSRRGMSLESKCCTCAVKLQHKVMKETDPIGYAKRQSSASLKAQKSMKENGTGIYNQEVRDKIEKSKLKNGFYRKLQDSSKKWREENPEKVKKMAINGGLATAKIIKNMSEEEKLQWVKRSCNSKQANINKSIAKAKNTKIKFCELCEKDTFHLNGMCTKCNPSSGIGRPIGTKKAKEMRSLVANIGGIASKEWRDYKFDINCSVNCKNINLCINKKSKKNKWGFCNLIGGNIPSFKIVDDTKYYFDKSINQYVIWEDYKLKFSRMRLTKDINIFISKIKSLDILKYSSIDDIFLQSTFRTQESENWAGKKLAFEQDLVDKNISWITYIKFYIGKNGVIRPLVIGKTGSKLVNNVGSDVSFSTDESHGPARLFLKGNNLLWDRTQILVIKAKSYKQALFFERIIAKTFNLFES